MNSTQPKSGRRISEAARAAAIASRRRKAENAPPLTTPAAFVTRLSDGRFGWEIRRFGGLVLFRSSESYPSLMEARSAGERVLADAP